MVQREVGERLAAGPGTTAYGAVSVKVAYWADGRGRRQGAGHGVPAPAEGRVGARRHHAGGRCRPCRPTSTAPRLFALVRAGFGQRRKMLRRSLAGLVTAGRLRRRPASDPRPGPRSSTSRTGVALARASSARQHRPMADVPSGPARTPPADAVVRAPAKLTLEPADHRRPRRRLPPARRRDGDARARRHAHLRRRATASTRRRPLRRRRADATTRTSSGGRCAAVGRRGRRARRQADPGRRRPRRRVGRRRRRPALGRRATTWRVAAALGADVPFCLVGGRARVTGIGEVARAAAARRPHLHARARRPFAVSTPGRLPGVGRARRPAGDGPNDLEPAALVVEPRAGRVAGPHPGGHRAARRPSPAAARPGSSRARIAELATRWPPAHRSS